MSPSRFSKVKLRCSLNLTKSSCIAYVHLVFLTNKRFVNNGREKIDLLRVTFRVETLPTGGRKTPWSVGNRTHHHGVTFFSHKSALLSSQCGRRYALLLSSSGPTNYCDSRRDYDYDAMLMWVSIGSARRRDAGDRQTRECDLQPTFLSQ